MISEPDGAGIHAEMDRHIKLECLPRWKRRSEALFGTSASAILLSRSRMWGETEFFVASGAWRKKMVRAQIGWPSAHPSGSRTVHEDRAANLIF